MHTTQILVKFGKVSIMTMVVKFLEQTLAGKLVVILEMDMQECGLVLLAVVAELITKEPY